MLGDLCNQNYERREVWQGVFLWKLSCDQNLSYSGKWEEKEYSRDRERFMQEEESRYRTPEIESWKESGHKGL